MNEQTNVVPMQQPSEFDLRANAAVAVVKSMLDLTMQNLINAHGELAVTQQRLTEANKRIVELTHKEEAIAKE